MGGFFILHRAFACCLHVSLKPYTVNIGRSIEHLHRFSAIGMVSSMAEEVEDVTTELPRAIAWMVPISFVLGFFFVGSAAGPSIIRQRQRYQ